MMPTPNLVGDKGDPLPDIHFKTFLKHKKDYSFKNTRIIAYIQAQNHSIWALEMSPDGKYVACGGEDKVINLYSIYRKKPYLKEERKFYGHTSDIVHLSWSNDGFLLSCSLDSTVRLWNPSQNDTISVFKHEDAVTSSSFNPDNSKEFVSCTFGLAAYVWNINDHTIIQTIKFNSPPTALTFSPDGSKIVVGCFNGFCYFYNAHDYSYITQFIAGPRHKKLTSGKKITSIIFSKNDEFIVATDDDRIRLYSLQNYSVIRKYLGHVSNESQTTISLSPDHKFIMAPSETRGKVFIWPIDHEKMFSHGGLGFRFKRDRSNTSEGFGLGMKTTVNTAIFTSFTTDSHLYALISDNRGRIYIVISD
ncbi:WD repeat-containing protein 44 [Tritrichomonas musculus]|uniref:WD repeat-containing protein 44 n=1 Tax=Tritrichomonas musculus TaxID=1915356 RepID=A0ABR2IB03_9EUKA